MRSKLTPLLPAIAFLGVFLVLDLAYLWAKNNGLKPLLIDTVTVQPSAHLLNLLLETKVAAEGHLLVAEGVRISVLNGCDGIEAMLMLAAAILVARRAWAVKAAGIAAGVILIWSINQLRVAALFASYIHAPDWFESIHGLIGPVVVVGAAALFFLWWSRDGAWRSNPA
ncbi:archaeosortase/exosortase family protein [Halochromatium glycolicum]|uniref:Exosortase/archaeosortase family protein n=1 Tax=Halochromatium glycolicum TaxID=85075 RepID=A0AAJ0U8R0_9GAMM|nr:archaeosortase/exosortase family protein [Halochromatium glycolicum]MBK1707321.1 hypothetical protein [Halochromatium glycolicum]